MTHKTVTRLRMPYTPKPDLHYSRTTSRIQRSSFSITCLDDSHPGASLCMLTSRGWMSVDFFPALFGQIDGLVYTTCYINYRSHSHFFSTHTAHFNRKYDFYGGGIVPKKDFWTRVVRLFQAPMGILSGSRDRQSSVYFYLFGLLDIQLEYPQRISTSRSCWIYKFSNIPSAGLTDLQNHRTSIPSCRQAYKPSCQVTG